MATSTWTKVNDFVEDIHHKVHDLSTDQITVALSNTAPSAETNDPTADGNGILANVTEIVYTNCSSRDLVLSSSGQTGGTYKPVFDDLTLSASGGDVGPFQYVYIYNGAPVDNNLIGYYDYGVSLTLNDGESLQIDLDNVDGMFNLA